MSHIGGISGSGKVAAAGVIFKFFYYNYDAVDSLFPDRAVKYVDVLKFVQRVYRGSI